MHEILNGVIALFGILYMLLLGIWFIRAVIFMATLGSPIMGITERITILVGFQWTFILALWMFSRKGSASR